MELDRIAKSVEKEDRAKERALRGNERQPKLIQPKNRAPAPRQITAEQLLRESVEYKEVALEPPTQYITNEKELAEYQLRKRKEFEDGIRRNRQAMGTWMRYGAWEASQKEWARARSVYERAIDLDYRNTAVWMKYIDFELTNKFIAHARNLFDRAITLLPRVDQFWYKYVYMEEMLGDIPATRAIFQRWLSFHPEPRVYYSFIRFELRYKEYDRVRAIYQQFTIDHHHVDSYIKYAKFEEKYGSITAARAIFDLAMKELKESKKTEQEKALETEILLLAFAQFEERNREYDRARVIYQYTLNNISKKKVPELFDKYTLFEKKHGNKEQIETVILSKKRFVYEAEITENPYNYDVWFDYIHLETNMPTPSPATIRSIYERALSFFPLDSKGKQYWKRYIYLWISYAIYEETVNHEQLKTEEIYGKMMQLQSTLPFKFAKVYILYADFLIRCKDLPQARLILGRGIGEVEKKEKIFRHYIEIELLLGEIDRVRKLYERWIELSGGKESDVWIEYARMEEKMEEKERWRMIMELAIQASNRGDMERPEKVWKHYIDAEIRQMLAAKKALASSSAEEAEEQKEGEEETARSRKRKAKAASVRHELMQVGQGERVRALYSRLLEKTKHVKVWISFAQFEASIKEWNRTRTIFVTADEWYRQQIAEGNARVRDVSNAIHQVTTHIPPGQPLLPQQEEELAALKGELEIVQSDVLLVKEERLLLLTSWFEYEKAYGTTAQQMAVKARIPSQIRKRRPKIDAAGSAAVGGVTVYEEYTDYLFPDEKVESGVAAGGLAIMEKAKKWKLEQARKRREEMERAMAALDGETEPEGAVNIDDVLGAEEEKRSNTEDDNKNGKDEEKPSAHNMEQ